MIYYFIINVLISIIALALIYSLKGAPVGLKLSITLLSLIAWMLPVQTMHISVPSQEMISVPTFFHVMGTMDHNVFPTIFTRGKAPATQEWLFSWIIGLTVFIGILKWIFNWKRVHQQLSTLKTDSFLIPPPPNLAGTIPRNFLIRMIPDSYNASVVGYMNPEIWIGTRHMDSDRFSSLIYHEWIHILHRDNFLMFFLFTFDCLFWWNPISRFLTSKARVFSEMRCDRRCQNRDKSYASKLAGALLLDHRKSETTNTLASCFFQKKNINILRLKELERNRTMLKRSHIVLLSSSILIGAFIFARSDGMSSPQINTPSQPVVSNPGVTQPEFVHRVPPVYPEKGKKAGISGYVLIKAIMGKDGIARDFQVLRGLGDNQYGFEQSAIDAVRQWEFIPGKLNGEPVDLPLVLKISFGPTTYGKAIPAGRNCHFVFKQPGKNWNQELAEDQQIGRRKNARFRQPFGLEITLDKDGRVNNYSFSEDLQGLDDLIHAIVDEAVARWEFHFDKNTEDWIGRTSVNIDLTEDEWVKANLPIGFRRIEYEGPVIPGIDLKDAELKDLAAFFAQQVDKTLVFDPNYQAIHVTYRFNDIKWGQALDIIMGNAGMYYRVDGDKLIVGSREFVYEL